MYSFPFSLLPAHSKIIIYGAGNVGKSYIEQIKYHADYDLIAVIDRNEAIKSVCGEKVFNIDTINELDYDFIVIAIDSLSISERVYADLIGLGIPQQKIIHAAFHIFENRVFDLDWMKARLVLDNIGSRLDKRLIRLEILQYYSIEDNYLKLDDEQKQILKNIQSENDLGFRIFQEDKYYEVERDKIPDSYTEKGLLEDEEGYYCIVNEQKLYFGRDKSMALHMLKGFYMHYESDNPHKYISPEDDGIDIPNEAIIADVGACEGYFGIKYLKNSKKTYFFECDDNWIIQLKKSLANVSNAELVSGMVGDKETGICLDDFFANRDNPTVLKIDVEGMELAVLRGAKELIDKNQELLILIATYHRQEDWQRIEDILNPDKEHPRFKISHSNGYYWHIPDAKPPYFRRGIMRAERIIE